MSRDELVRSALTADDRLDDIKRAQIWSRIEDDLARAPARRAWWPALALAGAAAGALAVWLAARHPAGDAALVAPTDTTLSARLGPYTRASLVGPARLDVVTAGEASVVHLSRGTLLADFTGGAGRSLRVVAPGAIVDIVGTLFAIEVRDDDTCVSVSHGRVRVTSPSSVTFVSSGETWCRSHALAPIAPSISDALAHHEAVITADARPHVEPPPVEPPRVERAPVAPALVTPAPVTPALVTPAPVTPALVTPAPVAPPRVESHRHVDSPRIESHAPTETPPPVDPQPHLAAVTEPTPAEPSPSPSPSSPSPSSPSPSPSPPPSPSPSPSPSPPPPPPPSPRPAAPPAPTADSLYASAESSLAHHDLSAADHVLATLLTSFPDSPLADQALYERARIAYQRHAYSDARTHLSHLAAHTSSPLLEPGAYMTCRIAVETHDAAAEPCLLAYRRAYPRSPHDLDVLGLLAELAYDANKCTAAAPFILELRRRYDQSSLARAWRMKCP